MIGEVISTTGDIVARLSNPLVCCKSWQNSIHTFYSATRCYFQLFVQFVYPLNCFIWQIVSQFIDTKNDPIQKGKLFNRKIDFWCAMNNVAQHKDKFYIEIHVEDDCREQFPLKINILFVRCNFRFVLSKLTSNHIILDDPNARTLVRSFSLCLCRK